MLAAAAIAVLVGVVRTAGAPAVEVTLPVEQTAAVSEAAVYVHVGGAVQAPGLYRLHAGARVVDAVAAAGGLSDTADPATINLARPVSDGEQLLVLEVGAVPAGSGGGVGGGTAADGRIPVNTADATTLEQLPGIGPALAGRIIDTREANGPFRSVDDLLSVPGIGEKVLAGLREQVVL